MVYENESEPDDRIEIAVVTAAGLTPGHGS